MLAFEDYVAADAIGLAEQQARPWFDRRPALAA
jgi:hypothetical protein